MFFFFFKLSNNLLRLQRNQRKGRCQCDTIQYNTIQVLLSTPHGGFSEIIIRLKITLKNTHKLYLNNARKASNDTGRGGSFFFPILSFDFLFYSLFYLYVFLSLFPSLYTSNAFWPGYSFFFSELICSHYVLCKNRHENSKTL